MIIIGKIITSVGEHIFTLTEDGKFFQKRDDVNKLAKLIDTPWTASDVEYKISIDDISLEWCCEYRVTGYGGIISIIYGYGESPEEALKNCKRRLKELEETQSLRYKKSNRKKFQ